MVNILRSRNLSSGDMTSLFYTGNNTLKVSDIKLEINRSISRPRFRFHILNSDETVRTTIPNEDILLGGSYSEDYQNGQRRHVSFSLYNESGKYTPSINGLWAGTKISFEMGMERDNGDVLWFPKGIYSVTSLSPSNEQSGKKVNVEIGDKFSILEGAEGTMEMSYTVPQGTEIEQLIRDILTYEKGNGNMIDPKPFIYDASFKGKKTPVSLSKEAGNTFGSIIIEVATMLSAEVFYDVEGYLNFVPLRDVSDDADKIVLFDFYEEKGDFGSESFAFNMGEVVNRVVVIGANINGGIHDAVAVNNDPASPLCVQRIGYRTAAPINDVNITSDVLAQERADYELRHKLILKTSFNTEVKYNPLLLVNNLITVTDNFYKFKQEKFLIQSISCPIDYSGTMNITTSNIRNIPFVTK